MDTCSRVQWGPAAPWGTGSWEWELGAECANSHPTAPSQGAGEPWRSLMGSAMPADCKAGSQWQDRMNSSQEVNLQPRVMSRDSQTGPWRKGETKDGLRHWPASGPGSAGLQGAEVWQPAALLGQGLTAMGWIEMGLGWNGLLGHGQGERKPQRGWPGPW